MSDGRNDAEERLRTLCFLAATIPGGASFSVDKAQGIINEALKTRPACPHERCVFSPPLKKGEVRYMISPSFQQARTEALAIIRLIRADTEYPKGNLEDCVTSRIHNLMKEGEEE